MPSADGEAGFYCVYLCLADLGDPDVWRGPGWPIAGLKGWGRVNMIFQAMEPGLLLGSILC